MIRFRIGLRARFLIATFALVLIPLAGFVYAVAQFIDIFENQILTGEISREMALFAQAYQADPAMPAPLQPGLRGFILPAGVSTDTLPENLTEMRPGVHKEIKIDGKEFDVIRRDVDGTRLYLVLDIAAIENFEEQAAAIAWACGIAALLLAALLAFWLSYVVLKPVKLLSQQISGIEPGRSRPDLASAHGDREIASIAQAFDKVLDRFDTFVAREQAFTEDASHELRTPLAIVASSAQLLDQDPGLSTKSRIRLQRLQLATTHMHELIEALLFLAREDGGGSRGVCDVQEVLKNAVEVHNAAQTAGRSPIHIDVQAPRPVQAPYGMVLAVLNNLLRNAVEHGGDGPINVTLTRQCLVIEDVGRGIDPNAIGSIFLHRTHRVDSQGQGLGLFVVKRICDRLGWRISVDSTPGLGTRFTLDFSTN